MWCNVHYPSQHHVFNIHRQDFTVNSPDQFFPALYIVWRELQTARSTFWKLQFTLTAPQLKETLKDKTKVKTPLKHVDYMTKSPRPSIWANAG